MQTSSQREDARHSTADGAALLDRRAAARALLQKCNLCELQCGVDRTTEPAGRCRLGAETRVYKHYTSLNEEPELVPTLRVFMSGCNFRCPYCDETPEAFHTGVGEVVAPSVWAGELAAAIDTGVKTVTLLGGEPSLHVHTILAIAAAVHRPLPLAMNSNMYMTPGVLELLEGVVCWYLADFKFGNDDCARRLAGVPRYTEVVRRNLRVAAIQGELIIRHLLLPGHLECCFFPIVRWTAENLPGSRFELCPGYVPCGLAASDPAIGRLNSRAEIRVAREHMRKLDLRA